jgi:hypothetical protein
MSPPWTLEKVVWGEKSADQRLFEDNVQFFKEVLVDTLRNDPDIRPEGLDQILPNDPRIIGQMLRSPNLSVAEKGRLLEVVLLRGGSYPQAQLKDPFFVFTEGIGPAAVNKVAYQQMAVEAVVGSAQGPELFQALSASGDFVNHRQPATQLMHVLLQENGWMHHDKVEDWINGIADAEVRGQIMFHVYDAASRSNVANELKTSVSLGAGWGPLDASISLEYESKHWEQIVPDIRQKVKTELTAEEEEAYNRGLLKPDKSERGARGD